MDKKEKRDWSWLPAFMPKVAEMVRERRKDHGNAHVNECWRRGVECGEPGWFFAREGTLMVGTPDDLCQVMDAYSDRPGAPMLMMKEPGGANGKG